MKVLLSAYACEPGEGSDPGAGWKVAVEVAKHHDVWVLTRERNRRRIEAALAHHPMPRARFVYYDLPAWASWWKRRQRGIHLYYYLWQNRSFVVARNVHRDVGFDVVHHVTFAKYWAPSFLAWLRVPLIWGPVGGAESPPHAFVRGLDSYGKWYEAIRCVGRWIGEHDPFVQLTAQRSAVALAATEETAGRLRRLGARRVCMFSPAALQAAEIRQLARFEVPDASPLRFISIGRLLAWKGFHLGLSAFAHANLPGAEYWVVGDGPERARLERLAAGLGIADRVRFWGWLPQQDTWRVLQQTHVFVYPSLHDTAPVVCAEAMAAGRPVICLDLGGPATQVTAETGLKVAAHDPGQVTRELAEAMRRLADDATLRDRMGHAGRQRSSELFCWESKGRLLDALYRDVVSGRSGESTGEPWIKHGQASGVSCS